MEADRPHPSSPRQLLGTGARSALAGSARTWAGAGRAGLPAPVLRSAQAKAAGPGSPVAGLPRRATQADAVEQPVIIIVDDDEEMRLALEELMISVGLDPICFSSTHDLLAAELPDRPGCLILDVRMPGLSGLDLQRHLTSSGKAKPIVFLTAHGDIPMTVQAMKAGAIDFLTKPHRDQALLDAIAVGIKADIARRASQRVSEQYAARLRTLTSREHQVLRQVVAGNLNKQIAFHLGISEVTVKLHRRNLMRKVKATSVAELVRAWQSAPATALEDEAA